MSGSKLKLEQAVAALRRYSLLSRIDREVTIYRLVQTVARDQISEELVQKCFVGVLFGSIKAVGMLRCAQHDTGMGHIREFAHLDRHMGLPLP